MRKENELVSVIIPSFRRCDTVTRAIDSVLKQTYSNIEILVVDDNIPGDEYSNKLEEVITLIPDSRVRLIKQKVHINGAVARNEGVKAAEGMYVAFLDDDDEWLPDKVQYQIEILKKYPQYDGIAGGVTLWDKGVEISSLPSKPIVEDRLLFSVLTREVGLATSSFLCKKRAFEDMGGFDPELKRSQDLQLFADFLFKYKIYPTWNKRTVKMHVESAINRLDSKCLYKNKEEFFTSIADVLESFSPAQRRRIKSAHYYEVAYVALREHNLSLFICSMIKGALSPISIVDLYKRYKER